MLTCENEHVEVEQDDALDGRWKHTVGDDFQHQPLRPLCVLGQCRRTRRRDGILLGSAPQHLELRLLIGCQVVDSIHVDAAPAWALRLRPPMG